MNVLKVSATSNPKLVAGAIAGQIREGTNSQIIAIGATSVNQAIKAIAIARGYVAPNGYDLTVIPGFETANVEGERKTIMKFTVERRKSA